MPFIQRHLPIFEQLSPEIDWEWHVVEGVALGRADSRRPYSSRSMEDSHRQYRSKDGTSEYLDYIVSLPNSRVVLYRKPLGKAWKDKLEMINTVVHRLTLEAMSCGCPVLIWNPNLLTEFGGGQALKEISGSAALLVNETSYNAVVRAVMSLVEDDALRNHHIQSGLVQSRMFQNWDKAAEKWISIITMSS